MEGHQFRTNTNLMKYDSHWAFDANAVTEALESMHSGAVINLLSLADELLPLNDVDTYILDNGTRMGAIATSVAEKHPNVPVLATDLSENTLDHVNLLKLSNVDTIQVNALDLSPVLRHAKAAERAAGFSHVFSAFVVQSTDYPMKTIIEMLRVTRPGGILGLAIWSKRNEFESIVDETFLNIDPSHRNNNAIDDENFPRSVEEVVDCMRELGLKDLKATTRLIRLYFLSPESYVSYLVDGKNNATEKKFKDWDRDHTDDRTQITRVMHELVVKDSRWKDVRIEVILFCGRKV